LTAFIVLTTYVIAASLQHVPWFLPMISDCQVSAPEKYIARFGMPLTTFFQQGLLFVMYMALSRDPARRADAASTVFYNRFDLIHCLLGMTSMCGFYMVGAISEDSNGLLHVIGAVTGFWGLLLYSFVLTIRLYYARLRLRIETWSLVVKALCVFGALSSLTAFGIVTSYLSFFDPNVHTVCAILEWTAAICLCVFQISLVNEILMELSLNALDPSTKRKNINFEYEALIS